MWFFRDVPPAKCVVIEQRRVTSGEPRPSVYDSSTTTAVPEVIAADLMHTWHRLIDTEKFDDAGQII
jgi:hypothetical protein